MKILIFTVFTALLLAMNITAQSTETLSVKVSGQKAAKATKLKIKFLSVEEDSRCPVGANCIWAGNARIKVQIIGRHSTKTVEMNTGVGARGASFDTWAIDLVELTPVPEANGRQDAKSYTATFKITRLKR